MNFRPIVRDIARSVSRAPARQFDIEALFRSGDAGAWFDPSDLQTLYQNSVGTLPVTESGQPVGLMLDKRRGLERGANVVTNGDFAVDASWTKNGGWTIADGKASRAATGAIEILSQVCLTIGRTYEIEVDLTVTAGAINIWLGGVRVADSRSTSGTVRGIARAQGNNRIEMQALQTFAGSIDNVVIREIPGAHAFQSTSMARPTYRTSPARLEFDGVDDKLTVNFTASFGSECTIARAPHGGAVEVLRRQSIGTSYVIEQGLRGLVFINRALSDEECLRLAQWLGARAGA